MLFHRWASFCILRTVSLLGNSESNGADAQPSSSSTNCVLQRLIFREPSGLLSCMPYARFLRAQRSVSLWMHHSNGTSSFPWASPPSSGSFDSWPYDSMEVPSAVFILLRILSMTKAQAWRIFLSIPLLCAMRLDIDGKIRS